ncbi:MAG: FadR/GntR family transcriptional regulator [Rectinema sp.]
MEPVKKNSTVDMASEKIIEFLQTGNLGIGEKLPTEKAMCDMLNISRTTVREAYRKLQSQGYIEIINGKGAFVLNKEQNIIQESINSLRSKKTLISDYLEVRMSLDPLAARLAALNRKEEDIAYLREIHSQFQEFYKKNDNKAMAEADAEFHLAIVKMTKNDLLIALIKIINYYFEQLREKSFKDRNHASNAIVPHSKIIDAIEARNPERAAQESIEHMRIAINDLCS